MAEKILISGGLGFIGMALAQNLLRRRMTVRLMDSLSPQVHGEIPQINLGDLSHDRLEMVRGDVRDRDDWSCALRGVSFVVHLAAETGTGQSMYRIRDYTATNVLGTSMLLDVLANDAHEVRKLVLASSRAVYGEGSYECPDCGLVSPAMRCEAQLQTMRWDPPCPCCGGAAIRSVATPETAKTTPSSIYAATKLAQEDLVRIASSSLGIPFSILRFQNVYGEGQSLNNPYTGILSIFSNRIRQNKPIYLFEDGRESRDFVHVSDVAEAVALSLRSDECSGMTMNVGSGVAVTVEAIAQILKSRFDDFSPPIVSGQYRVGDIRHCYADISMIRRVLGFVPKVDLEQGLESFTRWVKTQPILKDGLDQANRELIERGLMKA